MLDYGILQCLTVHFSNIGNRNYIKPFAEFVIIMIFHTDITDLLTLSFSNGINNKTCY